jgi:hypothetical protein
MRLWSIIPLVFAIAGCGADGGKAPSADASPKAGEDSQNEVVIITPDIKHLPLGPHPAQGAKTAASCRRAGGDWGYGYDLGMLTVREPTDGARRIEMCWPRPRKLLDAGKSCNSSADCIGNCLLKPGSDGNRIPQCQTYAEEEEECNNPLYYYGHDSWYFCPIV